MLQATAIGYLGQDAVIKEVNGKQVANFSVAHTEKFKDAQGNAKEKTTWIGCEFWTDSAVKEYLKQGQQVYVQGTPNARPWVNKEKEAMAELTLRVIKIELIGGKKENQKAESVGTGAAKTKDVKDAALAAADMPIDEESPF